MNRSLIIMRHAQAVNPGLQSDFDRELTPTGERDARHIGKLIAENHDSIDRIISSTAVRALSTAQIIREQLGMENKIEEDEELYEASVRTALDVINNIESGYKKVILIGHNPTVSYLSDYLTSAPLEGMAPGSFIEIEFEGQAWKEIAQNTGTFLTYQSPENI